MTTPRKRKAGRKATARNVMTPDPEVITPDASLFEAAATMAQLHVRHLPVVDDDGRLVGMLSDRDVRQALGDPMTALRERRDDRDEPTVGEAMAEDPIRVGLTAETSELAGVFSDERVGAIPVVDEGDRPIGIVSYVDLIGWLAFDQREVAP